MPLTLNRKLTRWQSTLCTLVVGVTVVAISLAGQNKNANSAQPNPYQSQCQGLWDAAGRQFPVAVAPGGPYAIIGMEIAEFSDNGPSNQAVGCISDKLDVLHSRWGPIQRDPREITLPHLQTTQDEQLANAVYGVWMSTDSSGVTNVSLLLGRERHLATVLIQADPSWTNQYLDSIAYNLWIEMGTLPEGIQTVSDQLRNTGLWALLNLPATMNYERSYDYLPVMFTGVDQDSRYSTPALLAGMSRVRSDMNGSPGGIDGNIPTVIATELPAQYPTLPAGQAQATCVPNQATVNCELTPLGVLQGRQTQTAEVRATERGGL